MSQDMLPNEPPDLGLGVRCFWPVNPCRINQVLTQDLARVTVSNRDDCLVNQQQNRCPGIASSGSKFVKGSLAPEGDLAGVIGLVFTDSIGIKFFVLWSRLRGLRVNRFRSLLTQ